MEDNYLFPYSLGAPEAGDNRPKTGVIKDGIEFNADAFRAMIDKSGISATWEQSYRCPCVSLMTLSPDPECPYCHGTGWSYLPAEKDVPIVIQKNNKGYSQGKYGDFDTGTTQATVQAGYKVSARDRISMPDFVVREQYLFNVTQGRIDNGAYIPYDVKNVIYGAYMDSNKVIQQLVVGKDYTIDYEKNRVTLDSGLIGTNVTLLMNVVMRFIVVNVDKELRYQYREKNVATPMFEELPRLVSLKREEVFINNLPLISPTDNRTMTKAYASQSLETPVDNSLSNSQKGFGL